MEKRNKLKIAGAVALIGFVGFLLGTASFFIYSEALPFLARVFPQILQMKWVMWGLIGAFVSVMCGLIYAYSLGRLRMLGTLAFIGFLGFLLGVASFFVYFEGLPILMAIFPQLFQITWVMWGVIGAFLSVICCLIYAYLP